jgi:signal transduction histidine kinase/ABC-type amino acid transport substrate-binding protein
MRFRLKPFPIIIAIVIFLTITLVLTSQFTYHDPLNVEQRAWLKEHPVIRLAPDPNFPPLEYFDSQGHYSGLISDYFQLIEQRLNIKIEYVHFNSWEEVLAAAQNGKIDGITAAQITPERTVFLTYTSQLLDIPNVIIVQKDNSANLSFKNMSGMSVAVTRGYAAGEYIRNNFPEIKLIQVDNDLEALSNVSFKQVDAAVVNVAIASYLIDQQGITNLRMAGDSGKSNTLAIAVRKVNPILRDILDIGLKTIDNKERQDIFSRWVHLDESSNRFGREFWLGIGLAGSIVILALLFILLWNVTLQNQVHRRTDELKRELEERHQAEKALHDSQELLKEILEISPVAISWSRNQQIEYINREWQSLFGYALEDIPTIEDWYLKAYPDQVYRQHIVSVWSDKLNTAQKTGLRGEPLEVTITTKDGTIRQVSISFVMTSGITLLAFQDLTMIHSLVNEVRLMNLNLEKRVQERTAQLEAANQELEAFASSVSHDLRAPLRTINGYSTELLEDYADQLSFEGQESLHRILKTSERMSRIIDNLLKLSRISRDEMQIESVDLAWLVRQVLADLKKNQIERDVEVVCPEHLLVMADSNLITIAIENMLRNAWKFTGKREKARIEFGAIEEQDQTVYFIRDNGAGFEMAYVHKLFGAFNRLHSTAEYEGTGIGLAIVKRIIQRHNGRIWAEGIPNEGAVFYFTLS